MISTLENLVKKKVINSFEYKEYSDINRYNQDILSHMITIQLLSGEKITFTSDSEIHIEEQYD